MEDYARENVDVSTIPFYARHRSCAGQGLMWHISHAYRATYYGFRKPGGGGAPGGARPPQHAAPDKPVPPGYVCYRCGQSGESSSRGKISIRDVSDCYSPAGHWIQDCPTNSDPDYRNKPRIKRTTGIPKSFLQTVEAPTQDGENQAGLMVTADGNFVIARPDA